MLFLIVAMLNDKIVFVVLFVYSSMHFDRTSDRQCMYMNACCMYIPVDLRTYMYSTTQASLQDARVSLIIGANEDHSDRCTHCSVSPLGVSLSLSLSLEFVYFVTA